MADDQLRYPIGKFIPPASYTKEDMLEWINDIKTLPGKLCNEVAGLTEQQLATPYRPGGWTIRQVVHHLADSHMNALLRFKWALTEDHPTIKPYEEAAWALLPDYQLPVEASLKMLEGIHQHLTTLLESFNEEQWNCSYTNPESGIATPLKKALALYAWHSKHHLGHIIQAKKSF